MADTKADTIDLVGLITAGQSFGAQTAAALAELDLTTGAITDTGKAAAAASRERADAEVEIIKQQGEKKLADEARAKEIMAILGTNSQVSDSALRTLSARITRDSEDIRASKNAIVSKMSVGPTDDLFAWIGNQFTLPTDVAIHNVKVAARDADTNRLAQLQAATKEQIAIANAADAGTTTALVAAQARARAALGVEDAAKWTFEQQRMGLSVLSARNSLNYQQLGISFNLFQAQNAADSLALQKTAAARAAESHGLEVKIKQLQLNALNRQEDAINDFTERYNDVRATLNLPASSWMEFQKLPKAQQDSWEKMMTSPDLASGRFAATPAESYALAKGLDLQVPGAGGLTAKYIEKAHDRALSNQMYKSLAPDQRIKLVNDEFKKMVTLEAQNIPAEGSILSLGGLGNVLSLPALSGGVGKMFADDLAPLAKDPTYTAKPSDFIATAEKLVKEGKVDIATAATQVAITFKAAAQDNAEIKQIRRFSVDGKVFEHFHTMVDTGFGMGTKSSVDMTNSRAVENILLRRMQIRNQVGPNSGFTFR